MATERDGLEIGAHALTFLAERPEDFLRFLSTSGADLDDVRARAGDAEFLGFALDFVLSEETLAQDFCIAAEASPERVQAARAALPGGDLPHWI